MKVFQLPIDFFKLLTLHNLVDNKAKILISCSGGLDSMALLYLLANHKSTDFQELNIAVAHINHSIHEKADEMQKLVENECKKLSVPFYSEQINVPALKKASKQSIEHIARYVRYEILSRIAQEINANFIATGHNRNDQEETILMMILQGSGITGLRGMPIKRLFRGSNNLYIIRPLLEFSREQIKDFMKKNNYPSTEDPTNSDVNYPRNKIRHNILPFLEKEGNLQVRRHLRGLSSEIKTLFEEKTPEIEALIKGSWHFEGDNPYLDINAISAEAPALKAAVMMHILKDLGISPRDLKRTAIDNLVEFIDREASKKINLPGGWIAVKTLSNKIQFKHEKFDDIIAKEGLIKTTAAKPFKVNVPGDTSFQAWGKNFTIQIENKFITDEDLVRNKTIDNKLSVYTQPMFAFTTPFMIRRRIRGDKFSPFGMSGRQKLKKFFLSKRIEENLRDEWPIFVDYFGNIIWVVGLEISDSARVSNLKYPVMQLKIVEEIAHTFPQA